MAKRGTGRPRAVEVAVKAMRVKERQDRIDALRDGRRQRSVRIERRRPHETIDWRDDQ